MSCKKNHLQLTHLVIKALFLILIFSSCAKEEFFLPENPTPIPDSNPTANLDKPYFISQKIEQEVNSNLDLQNVLQVLKMESHIRNLTLNTLYATYFFPQLRGIIGSTSADTRTGCPTSTLTTAPNGVRTMTLDYDNCTTIGGATYDGMITVIITGTLDVNGTTVDLTFSNDFTIDGASIDGLVSMEYEDNGSTFGYNITALSLISISDLGAETTVEIGSGMGGKIRVVEVGTNSGPLDLLDDNFFYEEATLEIVCPDPFRTKLFASINTVIRYNVLCGVPQEGRVQLTANDNGLESDFGEIDFAHGDLENPGNCDNLIAIYLANSATPTVPVIFEVE